jgi:aryl-phospho-beta-D-glucosidase BglC (GH1 family)
LEWLTDKIKEEHFANMKAWGVKLIRIPTGYWNWLELPEGQTPEVPADVVQRYENLQAVKPSQYSPFIDEIISYAEKYDMKFFFEIHGAPGSQNASQASGCIVAESKTGGRPDHYFDTDFNKELAVQTVGIMA